MMTTADSALQFPPSPCRDIVVAATAFAHVEKTRQKPRKKRSKLIRIDDMIASSSGSKPKYSKKPDPGAPKITRPCSECGKKFWSWKALFGHMRCHPERQWRGINPPSNFRRPISPQPLPLAVMPVSAVMSEEDHEIAACLLMLASGAHGSNWVNENESTKSFGTYEGFQSEFDGLVREAAVEMAGPSGIGCRFECSSCKKVFGSHQALGGHRASHKNVKGCFAITRSSDGDEVDNQDQNGGHGDHERDNVEEEKMLMVLGGHKCSICLRVFSSGQALGGHKRCHWEKGDEGVNTCGGLDLNMPAPMEDGSSCSYTSSGLTLDLRLGL